MYFQRRGFFGGKCRIVQFPYFFIIILLMKYKLAIFDLDGTILNTLDDLADSCNVILRKYGFPEHTNEEIKYMVGNGIPKLIERALPPQTDKKIFEKVLADYISYYDGHCAIKTAPYPGIVDAVKLMKSWGMRVAVNTNKVQAAAETLCKQYFPGLFDIVAGGAFDIPPKPAPDGVNKILTNEKLSPKDAVYIGDSDVDVQTGKNCGLAEIGVDWGFRGGEFLKAHGASTIVYNCQELISALQ